MIILLNSYHTRVPLDIYTISFGQHVTFLMIQNDIWWVSSGFCQKVPGGGLRYFLQITSPGRYAILTLIDFRYWNSHIYIVSPSPILLSIITRLLVSLVCRNEEKSNTCLYFFEEICV